LAIVTDANAMNSATVRSLFSRAYIAIVIPHYDDVARLRRCLEALVAQKHDEVEIVVADNGSPVDLGPLQEEFPMVRFIFETVRGAAAARNAGVAATNATWIAFLDSDCVPAPNWIARLMQVATDAPERITGGQIEVFDETPAPRSGAEAFETVFAFDQESYIRNKGFSVTANLVTSRSTFAAVGPFATGLSEDFDWCQRARAAGFRLDYDPMLLVRHPTRSDWPALRRKWRRLTEEEYGLVCRQRNGACPWLAKAFAMPLSAVIHLPYVLTHRSLAPAERLRGAATLLRLRVLRMLWMLKIMYSR
jgi:GT2 family glycosyltransferase